MQTTVAECIREDVGIIIYGYKSYESVWKTLRVTDFGQSLCDVIDNTVIAFWWTVYFHSNI